MENLDDKVAKIKRFITQTKCKGSELARMSHQPQPVVSNLLNIESHYIVDSIISAIESQQDRFDELSNLLLYHWSTHSIEDTVSILTHNTGAFRAMIKRLGCTPMELRGAIFRINELFLGKDGM